MIRFIQHNKKVIGLAVAALTFTACTETWDDHYVDTPLAGANEGTLWQALEQNDQLSNFRRVVEACGYDKSLKSSQMFTVFAPSNANFTSAQADSVIALYRQEAAEGVRLADNRAIKEFLQNHIARYTHSVADASAKNDSIVMMNGKYIVLNGQTFGGEQLLSSNTLYDNGVLFTLQQPVRFYNNIFEYVRTDSDLDSVAAFLYNSHYYRYELDEDLSVPGDIKNGKTTYLDSVMVKYNELFFELGRINSEDSTYWMLMPKNEDWARLLNQYEPYFQYHELVDNYDSLRWAKPRLAIMEGTAFSMTTNPALNRYATDGITRVDSVRSYNAVSYSMRKRMWGSDTLAYYEYKNPLAQGGVFSDVERIKCSNGEVLKAQTWNVDPRQTFLRDIVVEGENASIIYDANTTYGRFSTVRVPSWSKYYNRVSGNAYLEIHPKNAAVNNPDIAIQVPNVLSNVPYDIYIVTVPADAADSTVTRLLPTSFAAWRLYKDLDGTGPSRENITDANDKVFNNAKYQLGSYNGTQGKGKGSGLDVDTISLGTKVVFPTCSFGLDNAQVQIRILSNIPTFLLSAGMFDNTLRIDCIIFRPHLEATDEQ